MKHTVKILCITVLAALGLMATSASTAQALTLNVGGVPVAEEEFAGTLEAGSFLVPDLGLKIKCTGGTVEAVLKSENGTVTRAASVQFTGCDVVGAEKTCTINSPGYEDGIVAAQSQGKFQMASAEIFALLASENFSEIEIQGLCSVAETEESIGGRTKLVLLMPEESAVLHKFELDEDGLLFGEDKIFLHNTAGTGPIGGSMVSASEEAWAITSP